MFGRNAGKHRRFWIAASIVLLTAGLLRFWHLAQQGLFFYDEAWYQLVAQTYLQLPHWYSLVLSGMSGQQAFEQVYSWGFYPQISYKPTYMLLLMLSKLVFGITNPAAGAYLSAILGIGIVGMIFLILHRFTDSRWVALAGSALTAVSGIEVSYSRQVFPHQLAGLALLVYTYFYLQRLERSQLPLKAQYFLGFGIGMLLTMHDLMLPIIAVLSLFEIGILLYNNHLKPVLFLYSGIFTLGLLTPFAFWQAVTILLREFFQDTLGKRYVTLYYKEILGHVTAHKVSHVKVMQSTDFFYFLKVLLQTEGILFIGLMLLGFGYLLFRLYQEKNAKVLFLSLMASVFLGLISVYPSKVLRLIVPFFPLFLLTAGLGFQAFRNMLSKQKPQTVTLISTIILATVLIVPSSYSYHFLQLYSAAPAIAKDLKQTVNKGEKVATPYNFPLYTIYLQDKVYGFKSPTELQVLVQNKRVRYVIFDFEQLYKLCHQFADFCTMTSDRISLLKLEERLSVDTSQSYFNPYRATLPILLENHYSYDVGQELVRNKQYYNLDRVRVYQVSPNRFAKGHAKSHEMP